MPISGATGWSLDQPERQWISAAGAASRLPDTISSSRWRVARNKRLKWDTAEASRRRLMVVHLGTPLAAPAGTDSTGVIMGDIAAKVDKAYETVSLSELADAPVDALQGVSAADAEHLKAAFNIKTVRDLGTNKHFLWAQAIAKLAE
jgi:hypothetical protein